MSLPTAACGPSAIALLAEPELAAGLQSHGRSLFVWADQVEDEGRRLLGALAPLGTRLVVFGDVSALDVWPGMLAPSALELLWSCTGPHVDGAGVADREFVARDAAEADALQRLQRACALVPLPQRVLCGSDPSFTHHVIADASGPIAAASAQRLRYALPGTAQRCALVCCVATRADQRRRRLGRDVVNRARIASGLECAAALVEAGSGASRRFFLTCGWQPSAVPAALVSWS